MKKKKAALVYFFKRHLYSLYILKSIWKCMYLEASGEPRHTPP